MHRARMQAMPGNLEFPPVTIIFTIAINDLLSLGLRPVSSNRYSQPWKGFQIGFVLHDPRRGGAPYTDDYRFAAGVCKISKRTQEVTKSDNGEYAVPTPY